MMHEKSQITQRIRETRNLGLENKKSKAKFFRKMLTKKSNLRYGEDLMISINPNTID
jgi:hypothetical protein